MILALIGIVAAYFNLRESYGYSAIWFMLLLPAFLILFLVDKVSKRFIKSAGYLWLIQIIFLMVALAIVYWYWVKLQVN
jgi:hypothetical protein